MFDAEFMVSPMHVHMNIRVWYGPNPPIVSKISSKDVPRSGAILKQNRPKPNYPNLYSSFGLKLGARDIPTFKDVFRYKLIQLRLYIINIDYFSLCDFKTLT